MNEVFDAYTRELTDGLGRRGRGKVRVWCSWYSYYEDISEDAIARIVGDSAPYPFDILQIDDGWEVGIGDWQPNPDFPNGMEPMAELIASSGREAGLWLAPLIAGADSQLAHDRPELLLRDTHGHPVVSGINWGGPYYSLDPTCDATEEFLTDLITTVRSWGFTYLKLDFLYAAGFPGDHARPMPRDLAYRHAAEVMRRAAGDDCYLLACGAPVIASTGVFDGLRIGPDVAEFWEDQRLSAMGDASGRGARNAIATSSERLWLRGMFDADPDVVYLDRSEVDLDPRTLQSLQDLARITGFVGVSDKLGDLTPEEGERLVSLLTDEPRISRRSDQRWAIDDRDVDFDWVQSDAAPVTPEEVR
jgi:alpha-galactosidase